MVRRKKLTDDAENLFGEVLFSDSEESNNSTNNKNNKKRIIKKRKLKKNKTKIDSNEVTDINPTSTEDQWWNIAPESKKVKWTFFDKIVISIEILFIIYFILWLAGLVSIF